MKQELQRYLEEQFMFKFGDEVTEDTDLFMAGILDSFGYILLMRHIEEQYGIKFGEDSLSGDIMVSLSSMVDFIEARRCK